MTDHSTQSDRIDAAYATAAETLDDPSTARRRAALLDAVAGNQSELDVAEPAAAQTGRLRRSPARWWGVMAAAAVVGLSSLLVLQMEGDRGRQPVSTEPRAEQAMEQPERRAAADKRVASPPVDAAKSVERRSLAETRTSLRQTEASQPSTARESLSISSADTAAPQRSAAAGALPAVPPMAKAGSSAGLIAAVDAGDIDAVKRQLTLAPADAEKDADGRTALAHAVLASKPELVRLLLQAGADRLTRDRAGQTPLDHAAAIGDAKVLEVLRQR